MEFKCEVANHPSWWTEAKHVIKGGWCKFCYYERLTLNINDTEFSKVVAKKGGKITGPYKNLHTECEVICGLGHQWAARPQRIVDGTWCPFCSRGLSERICRTTVEQMFKQSFLLADQLGCVIRTEI